jgi:hypothetical protein
MNIKSIFLCTCLAVIPAIAGKIVTYTATSKISQEEANNSAIAGVAKQVKSKISATQKQTKFEDIYNGESTLGETYRANNTVKSNVVLKGVKVVPVKMEKGKGYKATATLDMDEFTADLRFRLNSLKQDVADLEKSCKQAFSDRIYINVVNDLEQAKEKVNEYNFYLAQLADIYPIDDTYRLQHSLPEIEKALVERLSSLKFETTASNIEIARPEMPAWDIIVRDSIGPVPSFPLVARQSRTLAERRTQSDGVATFNLRNMNFEKGPYVIIIEPNLPYELLRKTGMMNAFEVPYSVRRSSCAIKLQCSQPSNVCMAIENALSKKNIFTTDDTNGPQLKTDVSASLRNKLGSLSSYDVSISIKGMGIDFFSMSKGAGKSEVDATLSAIKKTDFAPLQKQLEPYCKK